MFLLNESSSCRHRFPFTDIRQVRHVCNTSFTVHSILATLTSNDCLTPAIIPERHVLKSCSRVEETAPPITTNVDSESNQFQFPLQGRKKKGATVTATSTLTIFTVSYNKEYSYCSYVLERVDNIAVLEFNHSSISCLTMGHQFSKSESGETSSSSNLPYLLSHPRNPSPQKALFDNDGLSRATEVTDESMTPPPSPRVGMLRHRESWRRGANVPTTTSSRASHPQADGNHSVFHHYPNGHMLGRDSDSGHPSGLVHSGQSRSVPVKCPPRTRQTASGGTAPGNAAGGAAVSPEDGLETSYLERMYDSRTWEMYRRITEARKRSRTTYLPTKASVATSATTIPASNLLQIETVNGTTSSPARSSEDTNEWEHLQQEEETSGEESQHEMIFLFDF
jgi:hypothetical protein